MCVRYTLHAPDAALSALAKALGVRLDPTDWMQPRYNVAPSQLAPVVLRLGEPKLRPMRWGMIPPADRHAPKPRLLTNARAETLAQLPAFREAAAQRRCLVPANGFYEFKNLGRRKEPYVFTLANAEPFAFAGLWEPPLADGPPSFCIVTTGPNATIAPVHNRMPVLLTAETMGRWLGDQPLEPADQRELTQPLAAELLVARKVNAYVNNSRHEGPECLATPDPAPPEFDFG